MKTKILLPAFLCMIILFGLKTQAQNIFPSTGAAGIGTTSPNSSSLLEIKSTTKGVLMPRMTQSQRNAIPVATSTKGLLIYQTDGTPGYYYYSGTSWQPISGKAWSLIGNANTDSTKNFIGTKDAHPLIFRVNNLRAGYIGYGTSNTSFGYNAFSSNTSGNYNTAIGTFSLSANTIGYNNIAFGSYALTTNTSGNYNMAIGSDALHNNLNGSSNNAFGHQALYNNIGGSNNVATGYQALFSNTSGTGNSATGYQSLFNNKDGHDNVGVGYAALWTNISGTGNTGTGNYSLYNTTGSSNTANGFQALFYNTTGSSNTANGYAPLYHNTTGNSNVANGNFALFNNTTGYGNIAIGDRALFNNTIQIHDIAIGDSALFSENWTNDFYNAAYNIAIGWNALYAHTNGQGNTAVGNEALKSDIIGGGNTAIGYGADVGASNLHGATAIGVGAIVDASNKMQLGSSTAVISTSNGYTIVSDGRFKEEIKDNNVPGLAFINKLHPVTYNFNYKKFDDFLRKDIKKEAVLKTNSEYQNQLLEKAKKRELGFIAQDVDKVVRDNNYTFTGVYTPQNDKDNYALDYSRFVVPLVKAVQELSKMNDDKDSIISSQQNQINDLETRLSKIEAMMHVQSTSVSSASLQQNIPNPFNHTTTINYSLPQTYSSAKIVVIDNVGKALKEISLSAKGKGSLNIDASTLASGAYQYSLYIDGKLIDTKQMVLAK